MKILTLEKVEKVNAVFTKVSFCVTLIQPNALLYFTAIIFCTLS